MVYQTEKLLSENRENLPEAEVEKLESELARAREALDQDDAAELKAAFEALSQASHTLAQAAYQGAEAGGEGPPAGGPAPEAGADGGGASSGGDDVIDADFEEA
jgi:molecular chaperone DnaK